MKQIRPLIFIGLLGGIPLPGGAAALDTAGDSRTPSSWGMAIEELEYRYSDANEEAGVWDADLFYGRDEFRLHWESAGEYAIEEQAFEGLESSLLGQFPVTDTWAARAGIRFDTPRGPARTYGLIGLAGANTEGWFAWWTPVSASDRPRTGH